jgi:hypothetical protein
MSSLLRESAQDSKQRKLNNHTAGGGDESSGAKQQHKANHGNLLHETDRS